MQYDCSPMQSNVPKLLREQWCLSKVHILYHHHLLLCLSPVLTRKDITTMEHETTRTYAALSLSTGTLHSALPHISASHGGYPKGGQAAAWVALPEKRALKTGRLTMGQCYLSKHGEGEGENILNQPVKWRFCRAGKRYVPCIFLSCYILLKAKADLSSVLSRCICGFIGLCGLCTFMGTCTYVHTFHFLR